MSTGVGGGFKNCRFGAHVLYGWPSQRNEVLWGFVLFILIIFPSAIWFALKRLLSLYCATILCSIIFAAENTFHNRRYIILNGAYYQPLTFMNIPIPGVNLFDIILKSIWKKDIFLISLLYRSITLFSMPNYSFCNMGHIL